MKTPYRSVILIFAAVTAIVFVSKPVLSRQAALGPITQQPQNQFVHVGGKATFSVGVSGPVECQWLYNGIELDGETNTTLTLQDVQISDGGYYSCLVANNEFVDESSAASLETYLLTPGLGIVVYALPIVSSGGGGTCPGKYAGYVNYFPTNTWGFIPDTNTTVYKASDLNRTNTKVEATGAYGDGGCAKSSVTIPYPAISPQYRFTIYFTNSVPSTNYPITLVGLLP